MRAKLTNPTTGVSVEVYATTEHPDSSYGKAVWVDDAGTAYCQVDTPSLYDVELIIDTPNLGEQLKSLREDRGYTLRQLATISGVGYTHIQRIEQGHDASVKTINKICAALDAQLTIKSKNMKRIAIRDREAGNIIDFVSSIEEAKRILQEYEEADKAEGIYTENFYEIVEL